MLVIFDCDGVLRSISWQAVYNAYIAIIKYLGKNPEDYFTDMKSFRIWYSLDWQENLKKIGGVKKKQHVKLNRIFHEVYDPEIRLFPWVKDILKEISSKHTITILSSALSSSLNKSLECAIEHISFVVGCDHVKKIKPHPEGIKIIMRKFQSGPMQTIMIGDADVDILAGKNAGVITGLVTWGLHWPEKNLLELKPDHVFNKPEDLLLIKKF